MKKTDSGLLKPKKNIFMPGMGGPLAGAFLGGVPEFITVGTNSGTGATISISGAGSIAAGDICIISIMGWRSGAYPQDVVPTGFTTIVNDRTLLGGSYTRFIVCAKKLVGTETTVLGPSSTDISWTVAVLRPPQPFSTFSIPEPNYYEESTSTYVGPLTADVTGKTAGKTITVGALGVYSGGTPTFTPNVSHDSVSLNSSNVFSGLLFRGWNEGETMLNSTYTHGGAEIQSHMWAGCITWT